MGITLRAIKNFFYLIITLLFIVIIDIAQPMSLISIETSQPLLQRVLEKDFNGHCKDALKDWDEFLSSSPVDVIAIRNRGDCLLALGDVEAAIFAQSQFLELNPYDFDAHILAR